MELISLLPKHIWSKSASPFPCSTFARLWNHSSQSLVYFCMLYVLAVRVCALEGQMDQCEAMAETMSAKGHQFVCVGARDR